MNHTMLNVAPYVKVFLVGSCSALLHCPVMMCRYMYVLVFSLYGCTLWTINGKKLYTL